MKHLKRNLGLIVLILLSAARTYIYCSEKGSILLCAKRPVEEPLGFFGPIKESFAVKVRSVLPSPHSELVLGMTIGRDDLAMTPRFKNALKRTGTIHVVVVSGFNMSLVAGYAMKIFGSPYQRRNLIMTLLVTLFYAAFTGFEPPVLRAWVMTSFMLIGKYSGRLLNSVRLLVVSYFFIIILNPSNFFSMSTYLSFLATFGLVVFSDTIKNIILRKRDIEIPFIEDLSTSMAAQITVWPLISGVFGQVSLVSLLVNSLVLWTVPITTIVGMLALFLPGKIAGLICFPFCDLFIRVVEYFSRFELASVNWKMPVQLCIVYYLFILFISVRLIKSGEKKI